MRGKSLVVLYSLHAGPDTAQPCTFLAKGTLSFDAVRWTVMTDISAVGREFTNERRVPLSTSKRHLLIRNCAAVIKENAQGTASTPNFPTKSLISIRRKAPARARDIVRGTNSATTNPTAGVRFSLRGAPSKHGTEGKKPDPALYPQFPMRVALFR
jgi:hypothetical protein